MKLGRFALLAAVASVAQSGCITFPVDEPNGACIATCTGCDKLCFDDESHERCRSRPGSTFEAQKSCEQLGYTKLCSSDGRLRTRPGNPCPGDEL